MLIKCDVEGAEYEVIDSPRRHGVFQRIVAMYAEFHDGKIPGQWRKSARLWVRSRLSRDFSRQHLREWI